MSPTTIETKIKSSVLPFTGAEYLSSLEDEREIWIYGKRVKSVLTHPAFGNTARMIARLYDALHNPEKKSILTCKTDTNSGTFTHPAFRVPKSSEDLVAARDAIAEWARMTYGWMGRTPDYKASFLLTLGANPDHYAPYSENARRWYQQGQDRVLYLNHAVVDPPVDRHLQLAETGNDVRITIEKETDAGLIVSGAKTVATNAAVTHCTLIYHRIPTQENKEKLLVCILPMNAPGVKLLCRPSYQTMAQAIGSPFDYPLSSRLDENDAILVCDKTLIPWENVLIYGETEKFTQKELRADYRFHGCIRLAVKLDFICGVLLKALEITGSLKHYNVQVQVGEILAWRNLFWSLTETMARAPITLPNGTVIPNQEAGFSYLALSPSAYTKIREIIENVVASGLIYVPSHADDFKVPEVRQYLDRYLRGSNGTDAVERVKVMKLLWDAIGTEFAGRHELYEHNYGGNHEMIRLMNFICAQEYGQADQFKAFADQCLNEYDLDGWTAPDLVNTDDFSSFMNNFGGK
ncbi:4-hydroxyphenylacetate 3-hydroxylase N-terminal domain-containing protein [Nostoc sp. FACHB-110]|uniref:4-hydroxyphenylacetate 3-hydroxylase N-terminal domain-containing protein n=1 Tax=Nostoc sp. FACHB-110 TaxID=2692834 RepID=UPI00168575FD|nr:4-hydroxyphenylacetate 3-hydroxylase N-terminal domain-containing protein [Nostoc sp. FACHB-110]MBD2438170.1 Pyoverdin chromophore biosynthetic protein pvcC [Nostoc sp. FACHB-110]